MCLPINNPRHVARPFVSETRRMPGWRIAALLPLLAMATPAVGGFHLWEIHAASSNADGSIQSVDSHTSSGDHLSPSGMALLGTTGYWSILQYPALFDPPERCCADFNGDMVDDDALGGLLVLQALSGPGANQEIAAAIESGEIVTLIDWLTPPRPGIPGPVSLQLYGGSWSGTAGYVERKAGLGHFQLDTSLPPGQPSLLTGQAQADGSLSLSGDRLSLSLLPGPQGILSVDLSMVSLGGQLSFDADDCLGICDDDLMGSNPRQLGGLRIGAILYLDDYFGALDAAYRQCACAGIDPAQPVISFGENVPNGTYDVQCTGNTGSPASCGDGCADLGVFCAFVGLTPLAADFDSNGNNISDALTVGLRGAVGGATIDSCVGADCPPIADPVFGDGFESRNMPPLVNDQSLDVDENSPVSTVVGIVLALDLDASPPENTIRFAIIGGTGEGTFAIDAASGEITVSDPEALDFETNPSLELIVMVTDGGSPRLADVATVTLDVNDIDEGPFLVTHSVDTILRNGNPVSGPSALEPGDRIRYQVVVENAGTDTVYNVELRGVLPDPVAQFTYIGASSSVSWPDPASPITNDPVGSGTAGDPLTWIWEMAGDRQPVLEPGESATLSFDVLAGSGIVQDTVYTSTATATGQDLGGADLIDAEGSSNLTGAQPALVVEKSITNVVRGGMSIGPSGPVMPGDVIVYSVMIQNVGNGSAYDVNFFDTMAAPLEIASNGIFLVDSPGDGPRSLGLLIGTTGGFTTSIDTVIGPLGTLNASYNAEITGSVTPGSDLTNTATAIATNGAGDAVSPDSGVPGDTDPDDADTASIAVAQSP